jgi:hypothetical protein
MMRPNTPENCALALLWLRLGLPMQAQWREADDDRWSIINEPASVASWIKFLQQGGGKQYWVRLRPLDGPQPD